MGKDFRMVAKTMKGLEAVLADELRALGAREVEPGHRMVSFEGDLETLYKANLCCRTALRILKPFYQFHADNPDTLYERVKEYDWGQLLSPEKTFAIDPVVNSETFTHSRYVTYRVKDAIVDWFRDRYGDKRPGVRLTDADVLINVHIAADNEVTLSLDSSGESLHKRGYRVAQTEAPINEVLAAGIILMSGYRGQCAFVDPMCGSGTFAIEAAMIAANINPGIYRRGFAFENWNDFDAELFHRLYNDDSQERPVEHPIVACDISPAAVEIARRNMKGAGVEKFIDLKVKALSSWEESPAGEGILVTNPPYGERISAPDMDALYQMIGTKLKRVFTGWKAWIIGYHEEYFQKIGLAPSEKISLLNGSLDCQLREYVIFEGNKKEFRAAGGKLKREPREQKKAGNFPRTGRPAGTRDRNDRGWPFRDDIKSGRAPRKRDTEEKTTEREDGKKWPFAFKERPGHPYRPGTRDEKPRFRPFRDEPREADSENPLAARRNPDLLKGTFDKKPSLPPSEGPIMRPRGWKKK